MENTTESDAGPTVGCARGLRAAAVYLADPTLIFHTGDCLVIDGGYTIF